MSELEKELMTIFDDCFGTTISGENVSLDKEAIERIRGAFVNDGWLDRSNDYLKHGGVIDLNEKFFQDWLHSNRWMTGQEWYEIFMDNYKPFDRFISKEYNDGYADSRMNAIKVAKRTSGLKIFKENK